MICQREAKINYRVCQVITSIILKNRRTSDHLHRKRFRIKQTNWIITTKPTTTIAETAAASTITHIHIYSKIFRYFLDYTHSEFKGWMWWQRHENQRIPFQWTF